MEWWNSFTQWLTAADTRPVLFTAAIIAIAMIASALVAAVIAKSGIKRLIAQRDREQRAAAIAALIDAATEATVWNSLTPQEQVLADRAVGQADIHVRLLPIKGTSVAADWAAHQLAQMKRASATFGYELEPVLAEFRDRLLDWQERPSRAKKVFQSDLERWASSDEDGPTVQAQDRWVAAQHHEAHTSPLPDPASVDPHTRKLIDDVAALEANKRANAADEKSA